MAPPIAIIGGGPSGLAFARLLHINNIDFVVYEKDMSSDRDRQGGSLDLHASTGQLVMKQAGLFEEFEKHARREGSATVLLDKAGNELLSFGNEADAPEIDRAQLRRLLVESIPADKLKWGKAVDTVERNDEKKVSISFTDATTATGFRLVVGADGAWSQVRHLLTPAKPIYSGKHYLESRISVTNLFHQKVQAKVGGGALIAVGSFKHLAVMCMGDGSYRIYIALSASENFFSSSNDISVDLSAENGDVARRHFVSQDDYFATWSQELKDIITHSEGPFWRWPLYHMPAEQVGWERVPGVTLLGDAAHVSTPFVGEGANCALFDSLQLVNCIKKHGTDDAGLERAITEYEQDMFGRGRKLIEESSSSAALLFSEDPSALMKVIHDTKKE